MRRIFNNTYFALRHGKSIANEKGIIVSHPGHGLTGYGLTEAGREQTRASLALAMAPLRFRKGGTLCFCSDFLRARETAEIFCELGGLDAPRPEKRLRERFFGELELGPDTAYQSIWDLDARQPDHHEMGCENPGEVAGRIAEFIAELEESLAGQTLVFVSHGDPLQIAQTIFHEIAPHRHRELPPMATGELRRLDRMT